MILQIIVIPYTLSLLLSKICLPLTTVNTQPTKGFYKQGHRMLFLQGCTSFYFILYYLCSERWACRGPKKSQTERGKKKRESESTLIFNCPWTPNNNNNGNDNNIITLHSFKRHHPTEQRETTGQGSKGRQGKGK